MSSDPAGSQRTSAALVTGAARGIGLAVVDRLAQEGWRVLATDLDGDELARQARARQAQGVSGFRLDSCDRQGVAALIDQQGPVQLVVNNAGVASEMIPVLQLTRAELQRVLAVNLRGVFVVAQEAARRMRPGGRIINIASRGYLGGAGAGHYVASKAGVVGLTRSMAIELRWRGINVNAVAPGMVDTRMLCGFTPEMRGKLEAREPSGRSADPTAIAELVAFLASPAADQIHGQVLMADAGKTLGIPPL